MFYFLLLGLSSVTLMWMDSCNIDKSSVCFFKQPKEFWSNKGMESNIPNVCEPHFLRIYQLCVYVFDLWFQILKNNDLYSDIKLNETII